MSDNAPVLDNTAPAGKLPTRGVGPKVNKVKPVKRIKAAHRRFVRAGGHMSLKEFARDESRVDGEMGKKWLESKKLAHQPHRPKPRVPKAPKADKGKKR
jgi:hypothetical protein